MFKILKGVQLNIGVEKVDIHKEVMVKVLLDIGATEMFMNKEIAAKHGFRLQKLEKPLIVKNVNRMYNSRGAVTYQVEVNMYYKNHIKRIRIDVCDLEKTDIILGMLWLQVYNLGNKRGIMRQFLKRKLFPKYSSILLQMVTLL